MSDEDGAGSSLNSTDTSRFLRELEALNSSPSGSSSAIVQSAEIGGSGDATITQLMNTMYNSQPKQKIVFTDREDEENNVGVYGREVDVFVTPFKDEDSPRAGSNKVKIKTVVHHLWDHRYYNGNLVAIHQDGGFVAFAVKTPSVSVSVHMVRVMHTATADRKLIKGFGGNVVDVAFAHSPEVMMAAVDDVGTLQVYACKLGSQGDIIHTPVLHVQLSKNRVCPYNRVVWCPYWPDEAEDNEGNLQDSSKVLACIVGGQLDVLAVDMVTRDCGPGPISLDDIESGRISLVPIQEPIVEAVFSPDGSALASASMDGEVKFFQINWNLCGDKPECLHEWKPHDGQPLSFFAFLDDLKNMSPDAQFWKFAVTGCNKNQELKVWSCETWNCLQVIRFLAPPVGPELEPIVMKAGIDLSARYIILSDKTNKVLYVLQVYQDAMTCRAHVSSIASFPLTQPCLSFAIIDASTKRFRTSLNDSHLDDITTGEVDHEEEEEEEEGQGDHTADDPAGQTMIGVQIKLYAIHPRALETLVIHYRPESTVPIQGSAASLSQDTISLKDGLSDVSAVVETSFVESEGTVENVVVEEENPPQPQVVSPDAFTTSVSSKLVSPSAAANTTAEEVLSSTSSFTHVTGLTGHNAEDLLLSPASSADHSASVAPVLSPKSALETSLKSALSPKSPGSILSPQSQGSALSPTSTLSPKSPKFSTPHGNKEVGASGDLTPSTIPLPPEEEGELATPQDSYISEDGSQLEALEAFFKPNASSSSSQPQAETSINTGTFDVDTLSKESPAAVVTAPAPAPTAPTAAVQGPSATADAYDENDQEVAEVLGEDVDQSYSSTGSGGGVTAPADYSAPHAEEEEDRPHKPWPRPPDVPASEQSVPGLAPPLPQALDEAMVTQEAGHRDDDDDDDNSEDQNEAEVEEEIEEVLEEADDDDDDDDNDEEEEGEDFRKTYREVEEGRGRVKVIKEVIAPAMLSQLQDSILNLGMEVSRQHEHLCRLQQQMTEQHHLQVDLQRQQLEQASMRSAAQPSKDLEQQLGRVQNVVASRVERALSTTLQKETKLLHDRLTSSDTRQTTYLDSLQKSVTQTVTSSVPKTMDAVVKNEFRHTIAPAMARATEQMKSQLHSDTAQKLAAMETVVKDQIGKLVRSRAVTDAVSQGMSNALFSQGEGMMRDLVDKRIIPSFSQSVDVMMTQINAIFQSGTTEYVNHLKKQIDKVRQEQESGRDPLIQQLKGLVDTFQQHSHHITTQLAQAVRHEVSHQINTSLSGFQEQLMSGVRAAVREEVSTALREQGTKMTDSLASYLRSGAGTPVPGAMPPDTPTMLSPQDQVKQLVSRRRFDKAFQMALSASNLELVVYVCDLVDPAEVFGTSPCLLSQPVLLSLIQQLSAELASSFNTKVRYLTEAVTILDSNDAVTQEHIPVVLEGLANKLRTYMASHPPNRDIRLLLMATNSLLATATTSPSGPTQ